MSQFADLTNKRVLVVGGSSGIGFGAAKAAVDAGATVVIASRSKEKVDEALAKLDDKASGTTLDTSDNVAIEAFFQDQAPFDHVVVSASSTKVAAVRELPLEDAYQSLNSKFWGAYRIARAAKINNGGSLILVSGLLAVRPKKGAAIQGAINAAIEGLTRGLALELAPVRVNCVSPGLVKTEMLDSLEGDSRKEMFENAIAKLPVGLLGLPEHLAIQFLALMINPYISGTTVHVDGGGAVA